MSQNNASVIVYVKQPVKQGEVRRISKSVRGLRGVTRTEVSKWARSFFSVDYNPEATDSKRIIEYVNDQGYGAVLVGM